MSNVTFLKRISLVFIFSFFSLVTFAFASNIDATDKNASIVDGGGLINMNPTGYGITVSDDTLVGYAWSENYGWINFNPTGYGVQNDGNGNLSGYAWGENTGWINFDPTGYGVTIDTDGYFSGYAWGEKVGWISFNCSDDNSCGTVDYKVKTTWTAPEDEPTGGGGGGGGGPTDSFLCSNGIDDDSDGFVDFGSDPDCDSITDNDESHTLTFCEIFPMLCIDEENPPVDENPPIDEENPPVDENPPSEEPENPPSEVEPYSPPSFEDPFTPIVLGTVEVTKDVFGSSDINILSSIIATTALAVSAITSLLSILFVSPLTFSEIIFLPLRLWSLLLTALGLKKKNRPWGVVYDSVTKQPLDPAYVTLVDSSGNEVSSTITDLDGRYGFLVSKGVYTIKAGKTNYEFPSKKLAGKEKDELYNDLYFGETINVEADEDVVSKNIPMDPINFDWNEFAKKERKLTVFYSRFDKVIAIISNVLFNFGFALATLALIGSPKLYNIVIFCLYIFFLILRETALRPRPEGRVVLNDTPLAFAIIRVFQSETGVEATHKITTKEGKFYCLVAKGKYFVSVEKKLEDGTYQKVYTSYPFEVRDGYIHEKFNITTS